MLSIHVLQLEMLRIFMTVDRGSVRTIRGETTVLRGITGCPVKRSKLGRLLNIGSKISIVQRSLSQRGHSTMYVNEPVCSQVQRRLLRTTRRVGQSKLQRRIRYTANRRRYASETGSQSLYINHVK